jgi:hypothetical protein
MSTDLTTAMTTDTTTDKTAVTTTVYVKTLAGDLLAVECAPHMPPCEFPFRVYPLLPTPRPPLAFLRFLPAPKEEEEKSGMSGMSGAFPMRFEEGDLFYLLVEDPEFVVHFRLEDDALDPRGDTMELHVMEVEDRDGLEVMTAQFYTPVVTAYQYVVEEGVDVPVRSFTDVYYREEDVEVVFNQPNRVRQHTGVEWRDVVVRAGATAHASPAFLAETYFRPEYHLYLADLIEKGWRRYVEDVTGQTVLYHLGSSEEVEEEAETGSESLEEDYDW